MSSSNSTVFPPKNVSFDAASYDEAQLPSGEYRSHWSGLLKPLTQLDTDEFAERNNAAKRILRNHGVTYNVAANDGSSERPWELDILPFVLESNEWNTLRAAVVQRAHLANQVLQDVYTGPQHLVRHGLIPPALLFANPSFQRCCRGIPVPGNTYLHLQAFDLARSPDGQWWVLDTRTQTPKGMGYTIENRTIVGRVFQDRFRELKVEPINRFFAAIREHLVNLAPSATGWPRVVLLTPGVHSTAYYEHALLARYLGYTLVEGADLTVRDHKVHLKTVEGPQAVDVILRQVDDAFCDPLELRSDSFLGVPGLVQAARAGKVLLANALGAALMETPALQAALPEVCRHMLGEALLLPTAPTRWCGEFQAQEEVSQQLEQLIVKNTFPSRGRQTRSGAELNPDELQALRDAIAQQPHEYVGQTRIQLSRAPIWTNEGLATRPVVLRVYVAANGDSYNVLPGGLTKVSHSAFSPVKGFQLTGGSKDTWVLGQGRLETERSPIQLESRPAGRVQTGVPSRTADNLFWLGRYAERLENLLRSLRCVLGRLVDESEPRVQRQAVAVCDLLTQLGFSPSTGYFDRSLPQAEQLVLDIAYQPDHPSGVPALCRRTLEIVNSVRDRFSGDAWRVLSRLRDFPGTQPDRLRLGTLQQRLHELMTILAALTGIQSENMVRGHEWRFLNLGRRLERSQNLCRLIQRVLEHSEGLDLLLNPLLEIADSSMSYRRQYYSEPEATSVLEMLLLDEENPRSFRFNLDRLLELSRGLPQTSQRPTGNVHEAHVRRLRKSLTTKVLPSLLQTDDGGVLRTRTARLQRWLDQLGAYSDAITQDYFNLLTPQTVLNEFTPLPDSP